MISIISEANPADWNAAIALIPDPDVYWRLEYMRAFQLHGDGSPMLLKFENGPVVGVCAMMLRDIADDSRFAGKLAKGEWFDMVTPYGYGGFIFNQEPSAEDLALLKSELLDTLRGLNVISAFFRFHPIFRNADWHRQLMDVIDLGKTVAFNLDSPELIWSNITSKNRNVIRKAEKNGIEIHHAKGMQLLDCFMDIYKETMDHDNAEEYYYFPRAFYESIDTDLRDKYEMFYATLGEEVIAMSIMLFDGCRMNYHLSGSRFEYRNLAPSNLLLYKAALWGCENGMKTFHLGGGVGSGEDSLYKFKQAFNRNSDLRFSIGKLLIDPEKYDRLSALRTETDPAFNPEASFFPLYRS